MTTTRHIGATAAEIAAATLEDPQYRVVHITDDVAWVDQVGEKRQSFAQATAQVLDLAAGTKVHARATWDADNGGWGVKVTRFAGWAL